MLISNKIHYFRNFQLQRYIVFAEQPSIGGKHAAGKRNKKNEEDGGAFREMI